MSRIAEIHRKTGETEIHIHLAIDGQGKGTISTGNGFFDHMLTAFAQHGFFDVTIKCLGDIEVDFHHSAEDIGISLGQAFRKALQDKRGIFRYSHSYVPMDEALVRVVADICGRSNLVYSEELRDRRINTFEVDLAYDFLKGLADHAMMTLHIDIIRARNSHHALEALFKGLGRTLHHACMINPAAADVIPSTKGSL
ncbi:imidazoleglycerol-phosphate dehydratase HisB [Chitinivibrio alkaliphilus]|uniref:Imidazoleglycerol-phosphate dehydratase n=1 Tax=Chitinivibrio alkaliphilus ACht1 TaxID=1313304 RepID=U7DC88_9BACT|nr:imidazoleglycerol-phosphate dehydratase HisB [Chitinivibrio alkaliphilus]ERP32035.1 imidazoleglycerol-phosphate dehydratase [Chitinivibrio alkaliphilus ACht1]